MKSKKEFISKYIISIVLRIIILINPILFSKAIDNVTNGVYNKAYIFIAVSIALIILLRLGEILNIYLWQRLYSKLELEYNKKALERTYGNSLFSLSRISSSEFINIINTDISIMSQFLANGVIRSIRAVEFFVILYYFYTVNLYIGLAGTGVSIFAFLILFSSSKKIDKVNINKSHALDRKTNVMIEFFLGIKEIKNFNIFKQINDRLEKYMKNYTDAFLTQRVVEDTFKFGVTLLIDLFRLGLIIYSIYLISKGQLTIGVLLVVYNYFAQLIDNFSELALFNTNYRQFKVAKNRYNKLVEYSIDSKNDDTYNNTDLQGLIEFKDILYGYRENPTLDNVNLKFLPNTINVIVGDEISGKTGIFDLLLKLNRQHEGYITIDGININEINNNFYFNNVSLVDKNPTFFNMSIKDNLSMINSDFSKIVEICKVLGIHKDIIQLKDGYDTVISNIGSPLTSTTTYLLSVAKVLIRNSKIMLFDESFDSLDNINKNNIMNLLKKYKNDHVLIIITRDKEFLKIADNILLMDKSKIIKSGKYDELKNHELYKKLT